MRSLHGLTAILLCYTLCVPAPISAAQQRQIPISRRPTPNPDRTTRRTPYPSSCVRRPHSPRAEPLHLRAATGDLEAVRKMGLDQWFDEQLRPQRLTKPT